MSQAFLSSDGFILSSFKDGMDSGRILATFRERLLRVRPAARFE
jgi:hypothetical protein